MYIKSYHGSKIVSTFGIFGVAIFLCITGYYIYNPTKRIVGLKFVKKILLRIWPAYFVAITICFALTRFVELPNRTVSLFEYFLNIPFLMDILELHMLMVLIGILQHLFQAL